MQLTPRAAISWVLTASVHLICLLVVRRKLQKKGQNLQAA